jgi:hypothetical protein
MNRLVNQVLKAALSELFVDEVNNAVQLSLGSDLFSSSKVHLHDLTLRPDIFDACLHPLKMVYGHLGSLKIEGVAEVALGGTIRVAVENVFLLFNLTRCDDVEQVHALKKILLELVSTSVSYSMVKNMLRKILGMATHKNTDTTRQKKIIFAAMKYVFKILQVTVKKIHIRLEFNSATLLHSDSAHFSSSHSAFGITLPSVKIAQGLVLDHINRSSAGVGSDGDPEISLLLKALQVYLNQPTLDYDPPPPLLPVLSMLCICVFCVGVL